MAQLKVETVVICYRKYQPKLEWVVVEDVEAEITEAEEVVIITDVEAEITEVEEVVIITDVGQDNKVGADADVK